MKNGTIIESIQNQQIKELAALSDRKTRRSAGRFIAEGVRLVREALNSGSVSVHRLVAQTNLADDPAIEPLLAEGAKKKIPVILTTREIINKITRMETCQGILAEVSRTTSNSIADADFDGITLLAHGVQDPRNMGLLIRTAEAAGVVSFFAPHGSTDPFHPTAVQTSMGAVFHHNIFSDVASAEAIEAARSNGASVIGTSPHEGTPIAKWLKEAPARFMLVVGNEGAGLDKDIENNLDLKIALPMWGRTESLNVAVSAGIVLYLARLELDKR
jgi:RNA methyltransferase, TrmH family